MKLLNITACKNVLRFELDITYNGTLTICESTPVVHGEQRLIWEGKLSFEEGKAELERCDGNHDRVFGRFALSDEGTNIEGICYVNDFEQEASENVYPYPQPETIKTLVCPYELGKEFGIKQSRFDVNLPNFMSLTAKENTIPYTFEGRTYYFYKDRVEGLERNMKGYEVNTLILLNAPKLFGSRGEKELLDICIHPKFEWDYPGAFISAFNITAEASWQVYGAFIEFLAQRYTRSDAKYGRIGGVIISKNIPTIRTMKQVSFERTNRIVDGHKTTVRYIAELTI